MVLYVTENRKTKSEPTQFIYFIATINHAPFHREVSALLYYITVSSTCLWCAADIPKMLCGLKRANARLLKLCTSIILMLLGKGQNIYCTRLGMWGCKCIAAIAIIPSNSTWHGGFSSVWNIRKYLWTADWEFCAANWEFRAMFIIRSALRYIFLLRSRFSKFPPNSVHLLIEDSLTYHLVRLFRFNEKTIDINYNGISVERQLVTLF